MKNAMTTHDRAHERSLFLSPQQRKLLADVVDQLIPMTDGLPGAGAAGVAEHVEGIAGIAPKSRAVLIDGLKAIEANSGRRHGTGFANLSDSQKADVLREVESQHARFFVPLIRDSYAGYYSNPAVLDAKGLPVSAPQPNGYEVEPFDPTMLDSVRARGKKYRDA